METMHIELPSELALKIKQEAPSREAMSRILAEALQMWLKKRQKKSKNNRTKTMKALQHSGLIMPSGRQRDMAKAMMTTLPQKKTPTRAQVEASLAHLKIPLSAEILAMRGEQ